MVRTCSLDGKQENSCDVKVSYNHHLWDQGRQYENARVLFVCSLFNYVVIILDCITSVCTK
jgi:hypothetical protein